MAAEISISSIALKCRRSAAIAVVTAGILAIGGGVQATEVRHQEGEHLKPNGKGWGEVDPSGETAKNAAKFAKTSTNGIFYHGGPLMLGTPKIYYIWYGNWASDTTAQTILTDFGSTITPTAWFNINTTYYDASSTYVGNSVALSGQISDSYSQGAALNDTAVWNVVTHALASGAVPTDTNAVYFVLTSQDVTETSGFCTQYCAWHSHNTYNGSSDIKYGFIGNPAQCPSACAAQTTTPNNDLAGDSMANLIAHELSESVTDPDLNAWFDRRGYENADKCAWKFGATSTAGNGSLYNVTFGTRNYLVQENWVNASGGYCALSK